MVSGSWPPPNAAEFSLCIKSPCGILTIISGMALVIRRNTDETPDFPKNIQHKGENQPDSPRLAQGSILCANTPKQTRVKHDKIRLLQPNRHCHRCRGWHGASHQPSLVPSWLRDVTAIDLKPCPDALADLANITFAQIDLCDEAAVAETIKAAHARTGRLDYLANVAGVLWFDRDKSMLDMDLGVWDQVFDINLKSMVHTVRAAAPLMQASGHGGAMIHLSSVQWLRGDTKPQDAYAASKAAVCSLSKSLAMQLAADNIRSNAILPGMIVTPMQARWDSDEKKQAVADYAPLGRIGTTDDIANLVLFLLSDAASYITGQEIAIDGGLLLRN